jgi:hypothetical protein
MEEKFPRRIACHTDVDLQLILTEGRRWGNWFRKKMKMRRLAASIADAIAFLRCPSRRELLALFKDAIASSD